MTISYCANAEIVHVMSTAMVISNLLSSARLTSCCEGRHLLLVLPLCCLCLQQGGGIA